MNVKRRPPPTEEEFEKLLKLSEQLNRVLGEAVSLMVAMPRYQEWRIADLKARILPPIALRQCKIFRQKGFPVAFVSWALLSEEIEKRFETNPELPLSPREWRSGSRLRIVDVASPKGNEAEIRETVRNQLVQGAANGQVSTTTAQ
jgi:cytolysin-activating lysine-acyltransferase